MSRRKVDDDDDDDDRSDPNFAFNTRGDLGGSMVTRVRPPSYDDGNDGYDNDDDDDDDDGGGYGYDRRRDNDDDDDESSDVAYPPSGSHRGRDGEGGWNKKRPRGTRESVTYKSYYETPGGSVFAPFDPLGYERGNFATPTTTTSGDPSGGLMGGDGGREAVFGEGDGDRGKNGGRKGNKRRRRDGDGGDDGDDGRGGRGPTGRSRNKKSTWSATPDPFGSGRSALLAELKAKFVQLTTPLTKFVWRYVEQAEPDGGADSAEESVYRYIQVRRAFDVAHDNDDWDGLVEALYGRGSGLRGTSSNFDPTELADTLLHMVSEEKKALSTARGGDAKEEESRARALDELKRIAARNPLAAKTAQQLIDTYNTVVSGKVVFLLHPVLLARAQGALDTINERWRTGAGKSAFTLLEMMNSGSVLNEFIAYMITKKQAMKTFGTNVMRSPFSGFYGGAGSSTTIVQTRASLFNHTAASEQYHATLIYFANVDKANDGSGGLKWFSPAEARVREGRTMAERRRSSGFLYDPYTQSYVRFPFGGDDRSYVPEEATRPVETLQDAMEAISADPSRRTFVYEGKHASVNPSVLSYRDFEGKLKLADRRLLLDVKALSRFYETGSPGVYAAKNVIGTRSN